MVIVGDLSIVDIKDLFNLVNIESICFFPGYVRICITDLSLEGKIIGDSTKNIMAGEIHPVEDKNQSTTINIQIDNVSLSKAAEKLDSCRAKLRRSCETVIG